jgi:hypothetical protein
MSAARAGRAASRSQIDRFETRWLTAERNLSAFKFGISWRMAAS